MKQIWKVEKCKNGRKCKTTCFAINVKSEMWKVNKSEKLISGGGGRGI